MTGHLRLETVSCGVCGLLEYETVATGKDFEYRTSDDQFQMVECKHCGNLYLNPRPAEDQLGIIYPPDYYSYTFQQTVSPIGLWAKDVLDRWKVRSWLKHSATRLPHFLDVGCGEGRFLRVMHRYGVPKEKLHGVELSEQITSKLAAEGFNAHWGKIEDVLSALPKATFDLIVMVQVLEHVANPRSMLRSLADLLTEKGTLIIETPNINSLDVRMFRNRYWGGYHFPRHWNLLNVSSITRLAESQQLRVTSITYLPAHTFWIYSLHHLMEDGWKKPRVAKFFRPFQNLPLLAAFTAFDLVRAKLGFRTSNMQVVMKK